MYEILRNVIESKDFELRDILYKISKMYVESRITEEQKSELDELARMNARIENSYASVEVRIGEIYNEIKEIKNRLNVLEKNDSLTDETTESIEEYPEYVQPQGAHDCYNKGDKITFKGKKKICNMDGCVYSPEEYPAAWDDVAE